VNNTQDKTELKIIQEDKRDLKPLMGEKELRDSINASLEYYENKKEIKRLLKEVIKDVTIIVGSLAFIGYCAYNYIIPLIS
jgi:hypothetical protein